MLRGIKLAFPELFKVQTVRKDMNPDKTQEGKKTSEAERFFTQQKRKEEIKYGNSICRFTCFQ